MGAERDLRSLATRATALLVGAILALAGLHSTVEAWRWHLHPSIREFANLGFEANLGTWFSSTQLAALAAVLLALRALELHRTPGSPKARWWLFLAAGALFLSADETGRIHEMVGNLVAQAIREAEPGSLLAWPGTWYRSYAWELAYLPVALPAAVLALRFLHRELGDLGRWPLLGVAVFLLGAVGLDMLEGWTGQERFGTVRLETDGAVLPVDVLLVEETLEMLGVTLVLSACLHHAARVAGRLLEGTVESPSSGEEPSGVEAPTERRPE